MLCGMKWEDEHFPRTKKNQFLPKNLCTNVHCFLFSMPMVKCSKLRSGSSRVSFVAIPWEFDATFPFPEWILRVVDMRLLFENNQLDRLSLFATVELSLLLEATAFLDTLPLRDEEDVRPLSKLGRWKKRKEIHCRI